MSEEGIISLFRFYGWWQLMVGTFSCIALLAIWNHITQDQESKEKDFGLVWLALAVLAWAMSGIVDIFYVNDLLKNNSTTIHNTTYEGLRSIFSMLNSALILLALPCFRHIPKAINRIVKSETWRFLVITTFIFSALITMLMILDVIVPSKVAFINSADLIYAVFTLIFLGLVLWSSFEKRGLKSLAYLSAICIACTLVAQVLKLEDAQFWRIFFSCTFKTILIMLFFALALTWVEELSKSYLPKPQDMHLVFVKKKNGLNKFVYSTILTIPPKIQTQQIIFTEKPYELFLKFAERRIFAESEKESWLEIQPRSPKDGDYDIKDYNQINRILDNILNETYGPNNWSFEEERQALKQALFDYQKNRKIRLRISPENIQTNAS